MRLHRATATAGVVLAGSLLIAGPASAQDDQNCDDFPSQAAAQAHYWENPTDPDGLDRDNDMVACEDHEGYSDPARDETPVTTQVATPPQGSADTGGASTSGIEHPGAIVAGGLALAMGAGGVILAGRRARD